jgi:hypothetical protein
MGGEDVHVARESTHLEPVDLLLPQRFFHFGDIRPQKVRPVDHIILQLLNMKPRVK